MSVKSIDVCALHRLKEEAGDLLLIDVREADEYREVCYPMSTNIPLSEFSLERVEALAHRDQPIYLICRSGRRSMRAASLLDEAGFESVYNVEGGMLDWQEKGLPVRTE